MLRIITSVDPNWIQMSTPRMLDAGTNEADYDRMIRQGLRIAHGHIHRSPRLR